MFAAFHEDFPLAVQVDANKRRGDVQPEALLDEGQAQGAQGQRRQRAHEDQSPKGGEQGKGRADADQGQDQLYLEEHEKGQDLLLPPSDLQGGLGEDEILWLEQGEEGEAHTVTGYTATADNELYDVTKDFAFSGTAAAARTDAGQTDMGLKAEQFTNTNANFANGSNWELANNDKEGANKVYVDDKLIPVARIISKG